MKPKVVHLIDVLEKGGAQKIVFDIVSSGGFNFEVFAFWGGVYQKEIESLGVKVRVLGIHPEKIGFRHPLNLLKTFLWLRKNIAEVKPDILQTHLLGADMWGRLAVPKRVKTVQTIHSAEKFRGKLLSRFGLKTFLFDRWLNAKTDLIVAVSEAAKEGLSKEGIRPEKIKVIYPGVDTKKFAPNEKKRKFWRQKWQATSKLVIGSVGRLAKVKRFDLLIKALSSLPKEIVLVLVGGGPEEKALKKLASVLGLRKRVYFLGECDNVAEVLNGFDIFVLCSEWEGFPLALIEAAANQKAIVAVNVGGIPEFVENKKTGILIKQNHPQILAKKLRFLYLNPQERKRLAQNAYKKAQDFDTQKMVDSYKQIYSSLL
ncbi:glycosyltransferase [bacterium]|nr:glycosyltransferase [bacterium]